LLSTLRSFCLLHPYLYLYTSQFTAMTYHTCRHCGHGVPTSKGLRLHITKTSACRNALRAFSKDEAKKRGYDDVLLEDPPAVLAASNTLDHNVTHDIPLDNDVPMSPPLPPAQSDLPHPKRPRVTIEEVLDKDDPAAPSSTKEPSYFTESFEGAGQTFGRGVTEFERFKAAQDQHNLPPWAPYRDQEEWELAQWLVKNRVSQKGIDTYLKLKIVSHQCHMQAKILTGL
jgi:hypothetical protein